MNILDLILQEKHIKFWRLQQLDDNYVTCLCVRVNKTGVQAGMYKVICVSLILDL